MATVKVYRVGEPVVGKHNEELHKFWSSIDAHRPEGQPARLNAVYAGVNAHAMRRWIDSAIMINRDILPHEITVDPDKVFVYSIEAYDVCYSSSGIARADKVSAYWKSAMTLTEWTNTHRPEEAKEWEVIIPPESIIKTRHLSFRNVKSLMAKFDVGFNLTRWEQRLFVNPESLTV